MRLVDGSAQLAIALEQDGDDGPLQGDGELVPMLERAGGDVAAAEDGLGGLRYLDLDVLPSAQPSLDQESGTVDGDRSPGLSKLVQARRQGPRGLVGHQHPTERLTEAVDEQVHGDAATARLIESIQELGAVLVVLQVVGRGVEEVPGRGDHGQAPAPLLLPVPQRDEARRLRGPHGLPGRVGPRAGIPRRCRCWRR